MAPIPVCIPRHEEPEFYPTRFVIPVHHPRRKALLIGINYDPKRVAPDNDFIELVTPQKDVEEFKVLLLDKYDFKEEDVVLMTDRTGVKGHLLPTRVNILREIRHLVAGARPKDSFVFLFAGHSDQIPNRTGTEDDKMDEVILPLDHVGMKEDTLILDNDLKKYLVDPLPIGARLTAIFDACHSGTLLDLKHYYCNDRAGATHFSAARRSSSNGTARNLNFRSGSTSSVRIYQKNANETMIRKNSIDLVQGSPGPTPTNTLAQRVLLNNASKSNFADSNMASRRSLSIPPLTLGEAASILDGTAHGKENHEPPSLAPLNTAIFDDQPRTMSPIPMTADDEERPCSGDCLPSPTIRPMVLSISACNDAQLTFEDVQGETPSLIQAIIKVLRDTPMLPIGDFMVALGNLLTQAARSRIKAFRAERAQYLAKHGGQPDAEAAHDAIYTERLLKSQNPQYGSHKPLQSTDHFTLVEA